MKLYFIGADREVTGSCHVIEIGGRYIMLDCGMEQGRDIYVNEELPVPPSKIEAVLLSHAHIDHSGLLPKFISDGFQGVIWCTEATRQLCEIMLKDSASIQEAETEWANRKAKRSGRRLEKPRVSGNWRIMELRGLLDIAMFFPFLPGGQLLFRGGGHALADDGETVQQQLLQFSVISK